jgi:hypothetical protein
MATAGARGWVRVWSRECQQTASMEAVYCNCYVLLVLLAVGTVQQVHHQQMTLQQNFTVPLHSSLKGSIVRLQLPGGVHDLQGLSQGGIQ